MTCWLIFHWNAYLNILSSRYILEKKTVGHWLPYRYWTTGGRYCTRLTSRLNLFSSQHCCAQSAYCIFLWILMTVTSEFNYTNLTPSYCLFPRRELDFLHLKKVYLFVICHKTFFLWGKPNGIRIQRT